MRDRRAAAGQVNGHIQIQILMVRDIPLVLGQGLEHHESGLEPMREEEGDVRDRESSQNLLGDEKFQLRAGPLRLWPTMHQRG